MTTMQGKNRPILEDILVLDLADETGSYCSRLLGDLGADVIKVERPGGDPSRNIGPFFSPGPDLKPFSLSFFYANLNKRSILLDPDTSEGKRLFERLLEKADVLVETFPPGSPEKRNLDDALLYRKNPRLIHLSITAFGSSGPKAAFRSSDSAASASGGRTFVCSDGSGEPLILFGRQSFYTASLYGAVAVLIRIEKRKRTGTGDTIDLSIQEAVASTLDHVMVDYFDTGRIVRRQDSSVRDRDFTILPCRDGYILITILRNWDTLVELMAAEGLAEDLPEEAWQDAGYREQHYDRILDVVKRWTADHTRQELFELGQAMRFPWAPVAAIDEVIASPQLESRHFFIESSLEGRKLSIPSLPFKMSGWSSPPPMPVPLPGEHTLRILKELDAGGKIVKPELQDQFHKPFCSNENILSGIRVLDLSRMLSGPYATRILADFGAEVIKIQTQKTANGAERNDTAYFNAWNRNKRSITLDLSRAEARECFLKLVAISDIVLENYSPRVMENWDLTYDRMKEANPSIIMLSLSAMGRTGPWKDYSGFGPTFHALSGLISASSVLPDSPAQPGHAYGDIVAGLYAAFAILAALSCRDQTGEGNHIDLSAYESLCALLGPALMHDASEPDRKSRNLRSDDFEDHGEAVPDRCFPCMGDDRWCAVTVRNDREWQAFCSVLNDPELESERFHTLSGRKKNRAELEAIIGRWTAAHAAESIESSLQNAGIAACIVENAADLAKDTQLTDRNFFITLKHPVLGTTVSDRSALWPWWNKPDSWRASPSLGEANHDVFVKLLGLTEETYRDYIRRGVIC